MKPALVFCMMLFWLNGTETPHTNSENNRQKAWAYSPKTDAYAYCWKNYAIGTFNASMPAATLYVTGGSAANARVKTCVKGPAGKPKQKVFQPAPQLSLAQSRAQWWIALYCR